MFTPYQHTATQPLKPILIWDGDCGFCKYWIIVWKKRTGKRLKYMPYQKTYRNFPEIPLKEFKKASRLIETDGTIFSGPDSAYKALTYFDPKVRVFHKWYHKSLLFKKVSNHSYNYIAKHRPLMMKLTHLLWGKNPKHRKPYWAIWLSAIILTPIVLIKIK